MDVERGVPAQPEGAARAPRRRGHNAGMHYSFCGGRVAVGAPPAWIAASAPKRWAARSSRSALMPG
jgi:hypothetical protein